MYEKFNMYLPPSVEKALSEIRTAGEEAFVVGGAVRDSLLCREVHDYDITTSARPERTREIFASYHTILTGEAHGTVTAVVDGDPLEITTYRVDGSYSDGRHPDSVSFATRIEDDLSRRDFTVNAIAYSTERGMVDPFGGREDIERRLIRCVGDPTRRFTEDALRILRAFRFAARLGFSIDGETLDAASHQRARLSAVSAERIGSEIIGLLSSGRVAPTLCLMHASGVLGVIFPKCNFEPLASVDFKPLDSIREDIPESGRRLAALRLGIMLRDSAAVAKSACASLKLSGELTGIAAFVASARLPISADKPSVRVYASNHSKELSLLLLYAADARGESLPSGECAGAALDALISVISDGDPLSLSELCVSGKDLIELGAPAGAALGRMLSALLAAVLADPSLNDRERLTAIAKTLIEG